MPGEAQPLVSNQKIVNSDGTPTEYFIRWGQDRQIDITKGITGQQAIDLAQKILDDFAALRKINTGTGLTGGGNLAADRTLKLADTAVTPGPYTNVNLTVDQQGRIVAISDGAAPGIPEAPLDGQAYARQSGAWVVVTVP